MKCDICEVNDASIHIQQIKGNEGAELHLCEACAASKGITAGETRMEFSISNLLTGLVDVKSLADSSQSRKICPRCGLTLSKFKKMGKLGCNECYSVFSREVRKVVGKMFGRTQHRGKYPKRLMAYKTYLVDIEKLKKKLDRAVKDENYEEAARLRDHIRDLQSVAAEENDSANQAKHPPEGPNPAGDSFA